MSDDRITTAYLEGTQYCNISEMSIPFRIKCRRPVVSHTTITHNDEIKENISIHDNEIKEDETNLIWRPWTDKSSGVCFRHDKTGVGDGEEKVAFELDCKILGQNSEYDMEPIINGIKVKCDVKKLDKQNDFNTGVEGRKALNPIKHQLIKLFASTYKLLELDIFTPEEKNELTRIKKISVDELAVGTLHYIYKICALLHKKREDIIHKIPIVSPYMDGFAPLSMPLDLYYTICIRLNKPFPEEYLPYRNDIIALEELDHEYIKDPIRLRTELHSLKSIFSDIKLIIVDEKKGYCIIDDIRYITFFRITRGHPRFKITYQGAS